MADATTPRRELRDPQGRSVEERSAKIDELLARIENEKLVSDLYWPTMVETVGDLHDLGDDLSWVVIAYLSMVVVRGDAMFRNAVANMEIAGVFPGATRPPIPCRCGQQVETPTPQRRNGRDIVLVRCPTCGIDLATFDGELYERRTLITAAF